MSDDQDKPIGKLVRETFETFEAATTLMEPVYSAKAAAVMMRLSCSRQEDE